MGVDRWPEDWERRKQGAACPLCASLGTGDDDTMNVAELPYSEVRIDRRSRLPGYCIVVWRHGTSPSRPSSMTKRAVATGETS